MTHKEIHEFLANTKVYVNGKSKEIWEKLFPLGYRWIENYGKEVQIINAPFLFINEECIITYGWDMYNFTKDPRHEISAEEIISLELIEHSYRPFNTQEECWNEMLNHKPFGWLKSKANESSIFIGKVYKDKEVYIVCATNETVSYSASIIFDNYTFADGKPFGIKEEV